MIMETVLVECIQSNLHLFLNRNAIFLCERLCAEFPSELNLQLLASCYLQNNQPYCTYHILKGTQMDRSRYLFALSCFQMDILHEAEMALCPVNEVNGKVPNGAAGHYLLGLIYRYTDRRKNAIDHFMQALLIDPFLWCAYEELCNLGAAENPSMIFGDETLARLCQQHLILESSSPIADCSEACRPSLKSDNGQTRQISNCGRITSFVDTPSPMLQQVSGLAPPAPCRNGQAIFSAVASEGSPKNTAIRIPRRKFMDEGKLRKVSGRLFSDSGPRRNTRFSSDVSASSVGSHGPTKVIEGFCSSKMSSVASRTATFRHCQGSIMEVSNEVANGRENGCEKASMNVAVSRSELSAGMSRLLGLLRRLGEGYRLSCLYKCQDALDAYATLPAQHYNTAWVLSQVGRAYFEMVDYCEADDTFSHARRVSPYNLDGMDVFSTVLYHLKEEAKLSYLAQELLSTDRMSPQAWCAAGNCYSLLKDHEAALKNFQRAIHLDSRFAYAYTLCGHEHVALEDFGSGIGCYQTALKVDPRHYNAWYGLGMVYLRQEKFVFAEHHFREALRINSGSSVLLCYLGIALHSLKRNEVALELMEKAILADKKNPLPVYQKGNILLSLERFDEAVKVLESLKEYVPRESSVWALLGKIYKKIGVHQKAVSSFGHALDLKPSAADVAVIKSDMETLNVPDELEDLVE